MDERVELNFIKVWRKVVVFIVILDGKMDAVGLILKMFRESSYRRVDGLFYMEDEIVY